MIQFMTDKPPLDPDPNLTVIGQQPALNGGNDLYFRCASVTLTNDPDAVISTDPEVGGGADAGPNDPDPDPDAGANNAGGDAGETGRKPASGGCQSSSSTGGVLFLLLAMACWWRRPRAAVQKK